MKYRIRFLSKGITDRQRQVLIGMRDLIGDYLDFDQDEPGAVAVVFYLGQPLAEILVGWQPFVRADYLKLEQLSAAALKDEDGLARIAVMIEERCMQTTVCMPLFYLIEDLESLEKNLKDCDFNDFIDVGYLKACDLVGDDRLEEYEKAERDSAIMNAENESDCVRVLENDLCMERRTLSDWLGMINKGICPGCEVKVGELHTSDCVFEECPKCGGKLRACGHCLGRRRPTKNWLKIGDSFFPIDEDRILFGKEKSFGGD